VIVLDTHIWVNWILLGEISLPRPILAAMDSQSSMAISAISCFEVSLLVKQGILELPLPVTNGFQKCSLDLVSYARRLHARQRSSRSRSSTRTKTRRIESSSLPPSSTMPCWRASTLFFLPIQKSLGA